MDDRPQGTEDETADEPHATVLDVVGFALGEGTREQRAEFVAGAATDLEQSLELAECTELLHRFRSLEVEPTGQVPRRLWSTVRRRAELRRRPARPRLSDIVGVLAVAAVCLIALLGLDSLRVSGRSGDETDPALALPADRLASLDGVDGAARSSARPNRVAAAPVTWPRHLPVASESFVEEFERLANREVATSFALSMDARNHLAMARRDARLRSDTDTWYRQRRQAGLPDLRPRTEQLAAELAADLSESLDHDDPVTIDLGNLALGVRALLASGSTTELGPHSDTVERAAFVLLRQRHRASSGDRLAVGAALLDLAITQGGVFEGAVAELANDLSRECRQARDLLAVDDDGIARAVPRPPLLAWSAPTSGLGEAGRILRLAPAFGADGGESLLARLYVLAHLFEREGQWRSAEQPELLSAMLYGFGDLIDRSPIDHRLTLWSTRTLFQRDPMSAQQMAWSRYPVRRGWAEFQQELPALAVRETPRDFEDAAALLMTLCTNTAAPGVAFQLAKAEANPAPERLLFFAP